MKLSSRLLLGSMLLSFFSIKAGDSFKTIPNDPYNVLFYELDNGLQVYLSVNEDEPRISTNIVVRTGSKNDPSKVTGLAHYLEHMLFKGTSRIASLDWEAEKPLLDQISDLYEKYRKTRDPEKRKAIYKQIDALSNEAAQYVATNEYDQMMSELGATGTNAYTSLERTVYINDIPANELEKWMAIESERFKELTLRLFHTELEAVYEEFNRAQDNDNRLVYYERMKTIFPDHTYGTQTTLGKGEHLKNPSMVEIHNYFDRYYVPNNMAIIMAGDLDPDKTLALIKKYFGSWKKGRNPRQFKDPGQPPITNPIKKVVKGTEAEFMTLSYRTGGVDTEDAMMSDLVSSILQNGDAGLIDQNLNNKQAVLRAYAYSSDYKDYSLLTLGGSPREDQTLDDVKDLLLSQVELLRQGKFDASLIPSIVKNAKKSQLRQAENNRWKAFTMIDAFIYEKPWEYYAYYYDNMAKISKQQIVNWVNKKLKRNYVAIYKEEGDRNPLRVEKPEINPVTINRGKKSAFRQEWEKMPSSRIEPEFINFDKDLDVSKTSGNLDLYYIPNETNELFELYYIFDMGSRNDKKLALAIKYLPYIGTENYTVDEIKRKFYDLALDYSVFAGEDRTYVTLSGLSESMEEGMALFEELLNTVKADVGSYEKFVDGIIKKYKNAKRSKRRILYNGMLNYALYGPRSPQTDIFNEEELRSIQPDELSKKLRGLSSYRHKILYYGPDSRDDITTLINEKHMARSPLKEYPPRKEYEYREPNKSTVYFVNYDQVQVELLMLATGEMFNANDLAPAYVFNQYFGSGLSSIVFQEIRESKALAYSAYCFYSTPSRIDEPHQVRAYIGTQNDKLHDAINAMTELMTEMPWEKAQFEQSKLGALKQFEANPITKASIYWAYQRAQDRGFEENYRPIQYEQISNMSLKGLQSFFTEKIKGNTYTYLVIGNKEVVNMEVLQQLGEVKELSLKEIFGY